MLGISSTRTGFTSLASFTEKGYKCNVIYGSDAGNSARLICLASTQTATNPLPIRRCSTGEEIPFYQHIHSLRASRPLFPSSVAVLPLFTCTGTMYL